MKPEKSSYSLTMNDLPQPQKIAVGFLLVLVLAIIAFWIWQMNQQITRPFTAEIAPNTTATSTTDISEVLKRRDTDGDGLSDYDEIYVYHTSPYLEDSDSDGLVDLKEVEQGTDPNCPQGKDCSAPAVATSSSSVVDTTATPVSASTTLALPANVSSSSTDAALQAVLSGQSDVTTLRKMLIASGANQADLDKISDADLMKAYQDSLNKQGATTSSGVIK
jgi:hypothetical protein